MAIKICIANQKGGVGKTTTTFCLASAKAKAGKMVLMIDMDPQFSLTECCNMQPYDEEYGGISVCNLFQKNINPLDCCFKVTSMKYDNLYIIPSTMDLAVTENKLSFDNFKMDSSGIETFKENIEKLNKYFDYIFFDCLPSLGQLLISSLYVADKVIIPVKPERLSYIGIELISETIEALTKVNKDLKIAGLLATMHRKNITEHDQYIKEMEKHKYGLLGVIPLSTIVTKELPYGRSCVEAHPTSAPAKAYINAANKI